MNAVNVMIQEEQDLGRTYRFDIFKGTKDQNGKVEKKRSIGVVHKIEGQTTYKIQLKTLLKDEFFLLPDQKSQSKLEYTILTRVPSIYPTKKYFWHVVGNGTVLGGLNAGLMKLEWDLFGAQDIYMNLYPKSISYPEDTESQDNEPSQDA